MKEGVRELAIMADTLEMDMASLLDGLLYRNYEFTHYKSDKHSRTVGSINILSRSMRARSLIPCAIATRQCMKRL